MNESKLINIQNDWPDGELVDDDYAIALADAEGEIVASTYGGPSWPAGTMCETCGGFISSGLVCGRCPREGFVKCPNTHEKAKSACVLCRATPGFIEELK
jgi:hypothetical protein